MYRHLQLNDYELRKLIRTHIIRVGGNQKLRIYGKLDCSSGKRMKRSHRVFFNSEKEAVSLGFRPCGRCMHEAYQIWKDGIISRSNH